MIFYYYSKIKKLIDNIDYLGSDEATTCCLLFLDNEHSIAVAHLDNSLKFESLRKLVYELINSLDTLNDIDSNKSNDQSNQLDEFNQNLTLNSFKLNCRLVGSYNDEKGSSIEFIYKLFNYLNKIPDVYINLTIACLLDLNTKIIDQNNKKINFPIFYGAAFNLQTNQFTPAEFENREPEIIKRRTRRTCSNKDLVQVYNSNDKLFKIDEFYYLKIKYIDQLINQSDQFILDNFSTSPLVEPAHFANSIREIFNLIRINKTKLIESKTEFKRESDGSWTQI